jgi:predicted Rossmann-fold nucleotide-binding protein
MKILICGSWESGKASLLATESKELGVRLAKAGFDVILGSGTGVARHVLEGFNSTPGHKRSIFYLPDLKDMKRVGEEMGEGADLVIQTGTDYPTRNLTQIKVADALAVIGGADATVAEIINAVLDYQKPVVVLDRTGPVAAIVRLLPKTGNKIYLAKSVRSMVEFLRLMNTSSRQTPTVPVHSA